MNIYIADFEPSKYDYEASVFESTSWWTKYRNGVYPTVSTIKAGSILKVNADTNVATFLSSRSTPYPHGDKYEFSSSNSVHGDHIIVELLDLGTAVRYNRPDKSLHLLAITEETYREEFHYSPICEFVAIDGSIIKTRPIYNSYVDMYLLLVVNTSYFLNTTGYVRIYDFRSEYNMFIFMGNIAETQQTIIDGLTLPTPMSVDSSKFPAYLIAKEDYELTNDTETGVENSNTSHLHFGLDADENNNWSVNIKSSQTAWYLRGLDTSNTIWDTCNIDDINATSRPYSFSVKGVISDYISLQWKDCYNEPGVFSLTLPVTDENLSLFKPDRYIMISKSDKVMIIESVKLNSNLLSDGITMQVSGRSLESILDRRVAFPGMALNTQAYKGDKGLVDALYDLVDAYFINVDKTAQLSSDGTKYFYYPDRKIEFLELANNRDSNFKTEFHASINKNVCKTPILDIINESCQNNNLGYKIIINTKYSDVSSSKCLVWRFILYNGEDKSYTRADKTKPCLIFSPVLNNVKSCATTIDNTAYKNVIFCGTERDSDGYIDLTLTPTSISQLLGIELPAVISDIRSKIVSKLQDNPVTYTGILILAIAANKNNKNYTNTIANIYFDCGTSSDPHFPSSVVDGSSNPQRNNNYGYPTRPITKEEAAYVTITYYKNILDGEHEHYSSDTGSFKVSEIDEFKKSTAHGWLTPTILREATSGANAMPSSWPSASGIITSITKSAIIAWFRTLDSYTKECSLIKWLCQEYHRSNMETGIRRREIFVEQESEDNDDWDASAINAWRASTALIKTNNYYDEESDEEINKKLLESAKKQAIQHDRIRDVEVDIDYTSYVYKTDYNLGDIVQVDDGYGNVDRYMINSVTIVDDTSEGERIIPEFKRHYKIPKSYIPLEYIRVANMVLPVIFSPRENVINHEENMNWQTMQPDIGPDLSHGYSGYINDIFERRSKWTEFEFDGKYSQYANPSETPEPLKHNFALISAIGYTVNKAVSRFYPDIDVEDFLPYALISSNITHPLKLGRHGQAVIADDERAEEPEDNYGSSRYFYQFIGDLSAVYLPSSYISIYSVPGIGIRWRLNPSNIIADESNPTGYLKAIYRVSDDSLRHIFYLNKAIVSQSSFVDNRELKYSVSYIDSYTDSETISLNKTLAKRPQFKFGYPYYTLVSKYYQQSEWNYGRQTAQNTYDYVSDYTNANAKPGNTYKNNPWNRIIYTGHSSTSKGLDKTAIGDFTTPDKHISIVGDSKNGELSSHCGAYGQANAANQEVSNYIEGYEVVRYYNPHINGSYRYVILGGFAYLYTNNPRGRDGYQKLIWDNSVYADLKNGVVIYRLKVYEYDSSFREYGWSRYKLNDDEQTVNTPMLPFDSATSTTFVEATSEVENVDISTRHLAHDYVPVKYVDVGESHPENNEIYGLYDVIQQEFIPVNYCPKPELFGEDHNSQAVFIEAGGEIARE